MGVFQQVHIVPNSRPIINATKIIEVLLESLRKNDE
jgi:hypothetical protein